MMNVYVVVSFSYEEVITEMAMLHAWWCCFGEINYAWGFFC